jgi:cob(I)alamin adenosyltransferase
MELVVRKLNTGCVHVYTGDGKGKTTASLGLALRAASSGLSVCMFQFLKARGSSVENWLEFPNFRVVCLDHAHPMFGGSKRELSAGILKELGKIKRVMKTKKYDVIILDELVNCVSEGFISEKEVLGLIKTRPKSVELVLTGRRAPKGLVAAADYVTKMEKIRHPFDCGLKCRKGIEY